MLFGQWETLLRKQNRQGGWSLMELVVVLSIIAILAAIITPMVNSYVDSARINAARNDVRNIAAAIISFNRDTRLWPIYVSVADIPDGDTYSALETAGNDAAINAAVTTAQLWTSGTNGDLGAIVNENLLGLPTIGPLAWNGAYMNEIGADPWGTRYYVNAAPLAPGGTGAAFVLSAGPDQQIDTAYTQSVESTFTVGGDDIVHRIQ